MTGKPPAELILIWQVKIRILRKAQLLNEIHLKEAKKMYRESRQKAKKAFDPISYKVVETKGSHEY